MIGEVASSRSIAAAPKCQAAGVPMITPSSTNPRVTQIGDYVFRVCFIDPFQGTVMAKFVHDHLHKTHAAILRAVWGPAYGRESNYLHVYVSQLRRKIEPPRAILTEPGAGYRLVAPPES